MNSWRQSPNPRFRSRCVSALLQTLLFAVPASAQEPIVAGRVIRSVVVASDPRQSYALYLPANYDAGERWPVLYCLDPGARGAVPVERFARAAEAEGFIVAGSNNSRNGPVMAARQAIEAMWQDTHRRFSVDDQRVYAAGHSGGARMALDWALAGGLNGVVACGAGFGQAPAARQVSFRIFFVAGNEDFNGHEILEQSAALGAGVVQRWQEFGGGHEWLPESVTLDALRFLAGKLEPAPGVLSAERRKAMNEFNAMTADFLRGDEMRRNSLAASWRKAATAGEDTPKRRLARQSLSGLYVGAMEEARGARARSDTQAEVSAWRTATLLRPESPGA